MGVLNLGIIHDYGIDYRVYNTYNRIVMITMTITYNIIITINAMFMGLDDGITMDNPLANYQSDIPVLNSGMAFSGNGNDPLANWLTIKQIIPATPSNPSIPYVKRTSKF